MHASWWDLLQVRFRGSPRPSVYLCVCVTLYKCMGLFTHCMGEIQQEQLQLQSRRNSINLAAITPHREGRKKTAVFIPIVKKTAKILALVFFTLPSSLFLFEISQKLKPLKLAAASAAVHTCVTFSEFHCHSSTIC